MSILEDIQEVKVSEFEEVSSAPVAETSPRGLGIDLGFLQAKTGEGPVNDYIDHPINFNKSKGMAQVIRGFTGLFGALDLAIIDIVVGLMQFTKERKGVKVIAD